MQNTEKGKLYWKVREQLGGTDLNFVALCSILPPLCQMGEPEGQCQLNLLPSLEPPGMSIFHTPVPRHARTMTHNFLDTSGQWLNQQLLESYVYNLKLLVKMALKNNKMWRLILYKVLALMKDWEERKYRRKGSWKLNGRGTNDRALLMPKRITILIIAEVLSQMSQSPRKMPFPIFTIMV